MSEDLAAGQWRKCAVWTHGAARGTGTGAADDQGRHAPGGACTSDL
jgi:hypothetical protein